MMLRTATRILVLLLGCFVSKGNTEVGPYNEIDKKIKYQLYEFEAKIVAARKRFDFDEAVSVARKQYEYASDILGSEYWLTRDFARSTRMLTKMSKMTREDQEKIEESNKTIDLFKKVSQSEEQRILEEAPKIMEMRKAVTGARRFQVLFRSACANIGHERIRASSSGTPTVDGKNADRIKAIDWRIPS